MIRLEDFNARRKDERDDLRLEMRERERRAIAAYWRNPGYDYPHPPEDVAHFEHEGMEYIQLSADVVGVLAVYRVRNNKALKRLKRFGKFEGAKVYQMPEDDKK